VQSAGAKKLPKTPPIPKIANPRPDRNWRKQNNSLVDRGNLTILVDPGCLGQRDVGPGAGKGRPYPDAVIIMAVAVASIYHLPLRQTQGFLQMIAQLLGLAGEVPDYSTLCRRRRRLTLPWSKPPTGDRTILIDATGASLTHRHGWGEDKPGKTGKRKRGKYVKIHCGIDSQTGQVLALVLTESQGAGSADSVVGPDLVTEASEFLGDEGQLVGGIGDGAYDSRYIYSRMHRQGGRWLAPLPGRPRSGRHPDRDEYVVYLKRKGLKLFKKHTGYHQRSLVESWNAGAKATVRLSSQAHQFESQSAEILGQIWAYDTMLQAAPIR
jgi:hypothetical protein